MEGHRSIAIAGTHGKTTTTALVSFMLVEAGLSPTYLVGGDVVNLETNAAAGEGEHVVVEADEFDAAFLSYTPDIAVVTNIEPDHLDIYGSFEELVGAFAQFLKQVPPDGLIIACADDPTVAELLGRGKSEAVPLQTRNVELYGLNAPVDWVVSHLGESSAGGQEFLVGLHGRPYGEFRIALPGRHNVANALAAIAVGHHSGVPLAAMQKALAEFRGAGRRFEFVGEADGITVMDDYAHHPTELRATIAAARERFPGRRLVGLFQPHTYSRTLYLLDEFRTCFEGLDVLLILETYAAREPIAAGMSAEDLAREVTRPKARFVADFEDAATASPGHPSSRRRVLHPGRRRRERGRADGPGRAAQARLQGIGTMEIDKDLLEEIQEVAEVRLNEPLSRHTTFGIGGPADVYAIAQSADQLRDLVVLCNKAQVPFFILGSGSNVLISDKGIRGVTIENRARGLDGPNGARTASPCSARNLARASRRWPATSVEEASADWSGPAAYRARSVAPSSTTRAPTTAPWRLSSSVSGWSARTASSTNSASRSSAWATARAPLPEGSSKVTSSCQPTSCSDRQTRTELAQRLVELDRNRQASQPRGRSAGSIFKNTREYPAWWLIDQVGLRGYRHGDAEISTKHPNFILNVGRATSADVLTLIRLAQQRVEEEFSVKLVPEVAFVGEGLQ